MPDTTCPHGMTSALWCGECQQESATPKVKKAPLPPVRGKQSETVMSYANQVVHLSYRDGKLAAWAHARFDGACKECGVKIQVGDLIIAAHHSKYATAKIRWECADCFIRDGGTILVIGAK